MNQKDNDISLELLEVFINSILYTRNIYPPSIFRKRKFYSLPIFVSIYPPLNEYIKQVLKSARELIKADQLHRIELNFYKDDDYFFENYVFEIDKKLVEMCEERNDKYLIDFEEDVRKSLLCLEQRVKDFKKVPFGTKFRIFLHTSQSGLVRLSQESSLAEFPWIKESDGDSGGSNRTIIPIGLLKTSGIQFYVEEFI